ncbi:MAG: FKBP-type peptidyl-prolyl cis-trans isomerase [Pseudomonadota bacterium]
MTKAKEQNHPAQAAQPEYTAPATPTAQATQQVQADSYLTLHYRLSDLAGNELVSTYELSPATLQMGSGQLAEPLEHCLIGLRTKQDYRFELSAEQAFGEHNPRLVERIARNALPPGLELKENTLIEFNSGTTSDLAQQHPSAGAFAGFLRELNEHSALFDFNHPLAGQALCFEVRIIGIL